MRYKLTLPGSATLLPVPILLKPWLGLLGLLLDLVVSLVSSLKNFPVFLL